MAYEHYHVMFKKDFAESPQRLGGLIFADFGYAAVTFTNLVGNGTPTRFRILTRALSHSGRILRSRNRKGLPYIYLAICRRTACDFDAHAMTCYRESRAV